MSTSPENLVKIDLVDSEISLLQTIIKKEKEKRKKETAAEHKFCRLSAWRANNLKFSLFPLGVQDHPQRSVDYSQAN